MKPVLILQHLNNDGPGYLADWLAARGAAVDRRNTEAGDDYPVDLAGHAALAILGGAMSANDDQPSLRRAEHLIRDALQRGVPVLGHCLGGQLMARALDARVVPSPQPEIGWQPITVADHPLARHWFGRGGHATVFQWHYEAFELPAGAVRLASSAACPNQAFAIGPHLAMQFHVEIDAHKVMAWAAEGEAAHLALVGRCATVQSPREIVDHVGIELAAHQLLADSIYSRWAATWRT